MQQKFDIKGSSQQNRTSPFAGVSSGIALASNNERMNLVFQIERVPLVQSQD